MRSLVHTVASALPAFRSIVTATSRGSEVDEIGRLGRRATAAHPDAVEGNVEIKRVEGRRRRTNGRENPAPVGILAVDGALEQSAPGDRPAYLDGVPLAGGTAHGDRDVVLRALGVPEELLSEVMADGPDGIGELGLVGDNPRGSTGHQQDRVVR